MTYERSSLNANNATSNLVGAALQRARIKASKVELLFLADLTLADMSAIRRELTKGYRSNVFQTVEDGARHVWAIAYARSKVRFADRDTRQVFGDTRVSGNAQVYGNAQVSGAKR